MSTATQAAPGKSAVKRFTLEKLPEVFGKTLGADGKPSFDHIYEYYAPNMRFQDSIQTIHGREPFIAMCKRLAEKSSELEMEITSSAQNGNYIFFQWIMTINFGKTKRTPLYGCSRLTLNDEGQILEQRDYYDLWGDTFDVIPGVSKLYRNFMRKVFG